MEHFPYLHLTAEEVVAMLRDPLEAQLNFKLPSQAHRPWLELSPEGGLLIWFEPVGRKPGSAGRAGGKRRVNTRRPA